ncbi:hypothetical protein ABZ235_42010, partial [Streptomyces canus]
MSRFKTSTMDADLQKVFGNPVPELHEAAARPAASPALARALELRSFLALTEEQVARVRDRVHADMDPDRDMGELSVDKLRFDAQWLQAALDAREAGINLVYTINEPAALGAYTALKAKGREKDVLI